MEIKGPTGVAIPAERPASYYRKAEIQMSAGEGPETHLVDRALADAIAGALETGGTISSKEAGERILSKLTDAGRYGKGEAPLARMLLSACDDRQTVLLDGRRVRLTGPAEKLLSKELPRFWGSLGQKAKDKIEALQDGSERVRPNKYV
jgi:hypothetical protein